MKIIKQISTILTLILFTNLGSAQSSNLWKNMYHHDDGGEYDKLNYNMALWTTGDSLHGLYLTYKGTHLGRLSGLLNKKGNKAEGRWNEFDEYGKKVAQGSFEIKQDGDCKYYNCDWSGKWGNNSYKPSNDWKGTTRIVEYDTSRIKAIYDSLTYNLKMLRYSIKPSVVLNRFRKNEALQKFKAFGVDVARTNLNGIYKLEPKCEKGSAPTLYAEIYCFNGGCAVSIPQIGYEDYLGLLGSDGVYSAKNEKLKNITLIGSDVPVLGIEFNSVKGELSIMMYSNTLSSNNYYSYIVNCLLSGKRSEEIKINK